MNLNNTKNKGFTLIEVMIGSAIFLVVVIAAYNAYSSLYKLANVGQIKTLAIQLAHEQFEIIRNASYSNVGIVNSVPSGVFPASQTLTRGGVDFRVETTIRNVDLPFDGQMGSSTNPDSNPADNKLVQIKVDCSTCQSFQPIILTGQIAPTGLEITNPNNGSILVQVFNANGQPVSNASIHAVDIATTTSVIINDVTDNQGTLHIIDVPAGANAYSISASKSGYSTDKTYSIGGSGNPSPVKPHATVVAGQLTEISFNIDALSTVNIISVATSCSPVANFHFTMTGAKQIGANVPKFLQNMSTNGSGLYSSSTFEWDSYTITPNDSSYELLGLNPLNPISVNPGSVQNISLVTISKNSKSLLATVEDAASKVALSDFSIELDGPGGYSKTVFVASSTDCTPPGEVLFQGLVNNGTYTAHITKSGYSNTNLDLQVGSNWQEGVVLVPRN